MIFNQLQKNQISSESIDCSNGYDLKNWLRAGAAVVVTIPSEYG